MTLSAKSFLAATHLTLAALPAAADLRDCIPVPDAERAACVDERFDGRSLEAEERKLLDEWIADDPGGALELLRLLEGKIGEAPALRAEILDRQAESLRLLGQPVRSAELALEALKLYAGTRSLEWWSPDGDPAWRAALDCTTDRHARAGAALLAVDRRQEARSLLAEALRLGADGEALRLWSESGGGDAEGLETPMQPIHAPPWYPRLPPARVALAEGEPFVVEGARGSVLILDFWASWCDPCLKELPALGELFESEQERGLEVVLINMGEAPDHALRFARRLGLRMPVGIYDDALEDAFGAATLPTVIVADREGRVRGRWDGYGESVGEQVVSLARRLLGADAEKPGEQLGRVLRGAGLLKVAWAREARSEIDSLARAPSGSPGAPPEVVALSGRRVLRYEHGGAAAGSVERPRGSGALRSGDLNGDGRTNLLAFRAGGKQVARLDLESGRHTAWESPAPLLDLAVLPPGGSTSGTVFLATLSGLYRLNAEGAATSVPGISLPIGLVVLERGEQSRLGVIGEGQGLCTLDPADPIDVPCVEAGAGWRLVAGPASTGIGIVPRGVAATAGRFLGGAAGEVATITSSNQLVILDVATGRERYRARLERLRALTAGDLDGDGLDELVLGVGERILVLTGAPLP